MLDSNVLAQLSQLKTDIQASKDIAEGTVAATSGRFGFVRCDDGRDAFLAPEKMDRVLPGDRVKVCLTKNNKDKYDAELETLLESTISKFVGQYRIKGKGHFVVPSGRDFNRWVFVPPSQRKAAKDGDFVVAKLARHPWKDSKTQANILFIIGQPTDSHIEHKYIKAKYDLNYRSTDNHGQQLEEIQNLCASESFGERCDLTALPFVTIDSATTLDMDDALYAEKTASGYTLHVAIANPSSLIHADTALAQQAFTCSQSVYLLGGTVPMLPAALAHYGFSLEEQKLKPALVCSLNIDNQGQVTNTEFKLANIRSAAKLSYDQVSRLLDEGQAENIDETLAGHLQCLASLSELRRKYREQHMLLSDDHADYDFNLDESGHIQAISLRQRNSAQQLVEESMVATNIAAGHFLAEHNCGLFLCHPGFREDRIGEVYALLKEEGLEFDDLNSLPKHIDLHKQLAADEVRAKYLPALRRMLQGSELCTQAGPHLGMGAPYYATITSPIRRYADMFNHWCILAILDEKQAPKLSESQLSELNANIRNGRQADRELQQWLLCLFAQTQLGSEATGKVRIVTQQGFGVKLNDTGIEGFVLFDKKVNKEFDAKRMSLTIGERTYFANDDVNIKLTGVDLDKHRVAFELVN